MFRYEMMKVEAKMSESQSCGKEKYIGWTITAAWATVKVNTMKELDVRVNGKIFSGQLAQNHGCKIMPGSEELRGAENGGALLLADVEIAGEITDWRITSERQRNM